MVPTERNYKCQWKMRAKPQKKNLYIRAKTKKKSAKRRKKNGGNEIKRKN